MIFLINPKIMKEIKSGVGDRKSEVGGRKSEVGSYH